MKTTPISIKCETCNAGPHKPCVSEAGAPLEIVHVIRAIEAARVTREKEAAPKRS